MKNATKLGLLVTFTLLFATNLHAETYRYDELGRLVTVENECQKVEYTYDKAGNRETKTVSASPDAESNPACSDNSAIITVIISSILLL